MVQGWDPINARKERDMQTRVQKRIKDHIGCIFCNSACQEAISRVKQVHKQITAALERDCRGMLIPMSLMDYSLIVGHTKIPNEKGVFFS